MVMKGFDPRWKDPEHYIIGITEEIWEGRDFASLHRYYAPDIIVRSPTSLVVGNQGVIAATMSQLAEFPDRAILAEDVIWSPASDGGFLSSHRTVSIATHAHDGAHGVAKGTRLTYRVIADCAARDNVIYDEWLVRDTGAVVRQLGWEPREYAADQIARAGGPEQCAPMLPAPADAPGPYRDTGNDHPAGLRYAGILSQLMAAEFSIIPREYDRGVQLDLPGGRTAHSHAAADAFWLGLRAAFPSAAFTIHHRIGRDDAPGPPRAALRWSLAGRHDGWGAFGAPTGAPVHVMGISHAEFGPRGLHREFVLIDETAIWRQILLHTG